MNFFDKEAEHGVYNGNLPHWRQSTVCYFVTFRTIDSIPQVKLNHWLSERDQWLREHPQPRTNEQSAEYHRLFTRKIEHWLDQNYGECLLANKQYKKIVIDALLYFNDVRYRLWEYTVAVNHVHLLIEPLGDHELNDILRSIKSYTANAINKARGANGHFWQKEYFDHILRSEEQFFGIVKYIRKHDGKVANVDANVDATSCRVKETTNVDATSCRVKETTNVDATSCRVKENTRLEYVSTIKLQDEASTIKLQDEASTLTRLEDVSTIDPSTPEQPC